MEESLPYGGDYDQLVARLAGKVRKAFPFTDVVRSGSALSFRWAGVGVLVTVTAATDAVEAVFQYDSSGRLWAFFGLSVVVGVLVGALGAMGGVASAVGAGAVGFAVPMVWVGYGNTFIAYSRLTKKLTRCFRSAVGTGARARAS